MKTKHLLIVACVAMASTPARGGASGPGPVPDPPPPECSGCVGGGAGGGGGGAWLLTTITALRFAITVGL